ncbi:MAG TPA: Rieske (2Fe-2S) protein [Amycolatopsis sp.]|nr:Rieske (2Fe-2S) protein [Amycolatopsis sp.]
MTAETPTRRTVLTTGVAVAGAAASTVVLAACGSTGSGSSSGSAGGTPAAAPAGTTVGALADVTVGKCKSVKVNGQDAILARPSETTAACFSAICTHQGCTVQPDGAQLKCPCHGSVFNGLTGAVEHGPAPTPLPAIPVKVEGTNVVTA